MEYILFVLCVLGFGAFGYFVMQRTDAFFDRVQPPESERAVCLRIAFENPLMSGSIEQALTQLLEQQEQTAVYLYSGTPEEISDSLCCCAVDVGLVHAEAAKSLSERLRQLELPDRPGTQTVSTLGLPVNALEQSGALCLAWNPAQPNVRRDALLAQLQEIRTGFSGADNGIL